MRTGFRIRRVANWVGLGGSLVILFLWIASVPIITNHVYQFRWTGATDFSFIRFGTFCWVGDAGRTGAEGFSFGRDDPTRFSRAERFSLILPRYEKMPFANVITVPLWLPFLAVAIPTALLWHRDRRRPTEGHCPNCNYNMTGNQSNKCPECGTPTPKPELTAPSQTPKA